MRSIIFNSSEYKRHQSEVMKKNWKEGKFDFLRKKKDVRKCKNKDCENMFIVYPSDRQKFCSHSCAGFFLNRKLGHIHKSKLDSCLSCGSSLKKWDFKYCSIKCQNTKQYNLYIKKWKSGKIDGSIGVTTKTTSKYIRRYLLIKYKEKCCLCGWDKINPTTGRVPLEIDHVNGDSSDNSEENLRIICPNCHSLSPNFRGLNKGKGRTWRMEIYRMKHKIH